MKKVGENIGEAVEVIIGRMSSDHGFAPGLAAPDVN